MKNFEFCEYTYRHRRALVYVIEKLIKDDELKQKMLERAGIHDLDKMLLYLFCDYQETIDYHVTHRSHHFESGKCNTYEDYLEMVLDCECAPYTKPDKPLNAYDFFNRLVDKNIIDENEYKKLYEIMHQLGIDSSYDLTQDKEGMQYVNSIGTVTEEMVLLDIMDYVSTNPAELEYIKNKMK